MYAYEDMHNGILVKYLKKYLPKRMSVVDVFTSVQEGNLSFLFILKQSTSTQSLNEKLLMDYKSEVSKTKAEMCFPSVSLMHFL
jgi:hypothetical protein